jgi:hypothetical protein
MKMKETKNYHPDGMMIYIPGCQYHIVFSPKYGSIEEQKD